MKKPQKLILGITVFLVVLIPSIYMLIHFFQDPSRLTPVENEWVNNNLNKVLNVSVVNDTNVFGSNGKGVFYDFLTDFSLDYGLKINSITYNSNESTEGIQFEISDNLLENAVNFYQDHYVLVSKMDETVAKEADLKNKKIGILSFALSYVQEKIDVVPNFVTYNSRKDLISALDSGAEIDAILVPRMEYMDTILSKDYRIVYHFTNVFRYYNLILDQENEKNFSSVLSKYYQKWSSKEFNTSFHNQEFQMFVKNLNISQTDVDRLQSVVYNYGFINNSPYEVLSGGNYGGIIADYLSEFSSFSNIEFNFKRYKNYKSLVSDINSGKVDLYFGYQNFTSSGTDISSNILLNYDILVPIDNDFVVSSLKSLKDTTIYVEENSLLQSRLSSVNGLKIVTYDGEKGLKNVIRNHGIIAMDHNLSLYYQNDLLNNYSSRYLSHFDVNYGFKADTNATFVQLFTRYIDYLDQNKMNYHGLYNHSVTMKNGTILGTIAKYFLYVFVAFIFLFYFGYRQSKKVRLTKKIKRDDKLKFIDQMTSLKNRNYLNENIKEWNKNTIYPQTMIVIDLNRIQDINDTVGYEEGDNQIKAAANILVKTQLDNSDIIRTDGNEFMIYLVGYQTKQITTFIHKLNKEFKNLPYEYGAAIGYSMIVDDIKSVEDAINEAIEDVKKQKSAQKEETDL